ncbi:MAG: porin [Opitutaceae bacterium]|nr:porin [Opitutaceae bacterium]
MRSLTQRLAAVALFSATAGLAFAQDNSALIDMLARKGIITDQEAEDLRADLSKENTAATVSTAKGNFLDKVTLTGRIQTQYVGLSTDIDGTVNDPASTNHWFIRRARIGVKANFMQGFSGYINWDVGGSFFDAAQITWKYSDTFSVDGGLRKAPIGLEEFITSSGSLKAIERSGVTRYFVESNNGRRLGAGKYRLGLWAVGGNPKQGFTYQLAVTNPEMTSTGSEAVNTGNASNNGQAFWAHAAYRGVFTDGAYMVGASAGYLPRQGGRTPALAGSTKADLSVMNLMTEVTMAKNFTVAAEYYWGKVENGAGNGQTVDPWGFYIMPSYKLSPAWELVARYGYVDSDGRGINLSDSVRSAPSGGTMNKLTEMYFGGTWYLRGNDVKLSAGYVWGQTEETVAGAPAQATSNGVRSQFQINF